MKKTMLFFCFYKLLLLCVAQIHNGSLTNSLWKLLLDEYGYDYLVQCNRYNRCGSLTSFCSCDRECIEINDCCINAHNVSTKTSSNKEYIECLKLDRRNRMSIGKPLYFVSKCPKTWENKKIQQMCEKYEGNTIYGRIPVSRIQNNITYQNNYCAMCHSISPEDTQAWLLRIHCTSFYKSRILQLPSLLESYLEDVNKCSYQYLSPRRFARLCIPESPIYIKTCPADYIGPLQDLCTKYQAPLVVKKYNDTYRIYKNPHCLECDTDQLELSTASDLRVTCHIEYDIHDEFKRSLAITLDFSTMFFGSSDGSQTKEYSCNEQEIWIERIKQCVELHCQGKLIPYQGKCVSYKSDSTTCILNLIFYINGSLEFNVIRDAVLQHTKSLKSTLNQHCLRIISMKMLNDVKLVNGVKLTSNETCLYALISFELLLYGSKDEERISCYGKHVPAYVEEITDKIFMRYIGNVNSSLCRTMQVVEKHKLVLVPDSTIFDNKVQCPSLEVYNYSHLVKPNNKEHQQNYSLHFYLYNLQIDSAFVKNVNDRYFICLLDFKMHYQNHFQERNDAFSLLDKLSFSCLSISVFSLVITLLHYCVISTLLTSQSYVMVHLMANICFSQLIYIIRPTATSYEELCWWLGVCLHFMFISMFAAMSLSLWHIAFNLRKLQNPHTKRKFFKVFVVFILPAYICALAIVSITVSLNLFVYSSEPWYGGDTCYITKAEVILFAFAIPVACCIIINVCIFTLIVRFLRSVSRDEMLNLNRDYFWISLKLSTIMGVSWVIGFIAVITRIQALLFVFEITSSLQGLFLSISLLTNQKIKSKYRRVFSVCNHIVNNEVAMSSLDTRKY